MYNIRDYIGECLDSCIKQVGVNKDDYEIIVVNDGSTDDSAEIAAKFIEGHENAIILNKQNGGLSDARNYGLEHSNGEYIWYIDGDDLINECSVKLLMESFKTDAQVYIPDYSELYPNGEIKKIGFDETRLPEGVFDAYDLISNHKIPFPPMMAWLQVQKKQFIIENRLKFLKGAKSEDIEYTSKLFSVATRVQHIKQFLYQYRKNRNGSIFTGLNNNKEWINNLINIHSSVSDYLKNVNANKNYSNLVLTVISTFIIYNLYSQDKKDYKLSRLLITQRNVDISSALLKKGELKSFIKWFFFKMSPYVISKRILGRY